MSVDIKTKIYITRHENFMPNYYVSFRETLSTKLSGDFCLPTVKYNIEANVFTLFYGNLFVSANIKFQTSFTKIVYALKLDTKIDNNCYRKLALL